MALRIISVRRAFTLLFKHDQSRRPVAEVVCVEDGRYVSYDFDDWAELSLLQRGLEPNGYDWIRTVRFDIMVPRIIRTLTFSRLLRQEVKFTRRNIFARDKSTCQYCGRHFGNGQLSLDHVVPRARGGRTTWDNVVCCCLKCNVRKGGRTPWEAGMRLVRTPARPRHSPVLSVKLSDDRYASWKRFLDGARANVKHS